LNQPFSSGLSKGHKIEFDKLLDEYYQVRGWNEDGIPKAEKLEELNLIQEGSFL